MVKGLRNEMNTEDGKEQGYVTRGHQEHDEEWIGVYCMVIAVEKVISGVRDDSAKERKGVTGNSEGGKGRENGRIDR